MEALKKEPLLRKNKFLKDEGQLHHENIIYNFVLKAWKYTQSFFCTIKENQMMNALYVLSKRGSWKKKITFTLK